MIKMSSRFPASLSKHIFYTRYSLGVEREYVSAQSESTPRKKYKNVNQIV